MGSLLPRQVIIIKDGGLGNTSPSPTAPLFLGCSSLGTIRQLYSLASIQAAKDTLGEGPLAEAVAYQLQIAGGPVLAMPLAQDGTSGTPLSTVTQSGAGPLPTLGGSPNDAYDAKVTIITGGALGAATFRYSLDGGTTDSPILTVPSGGAYLMPNTGVTVTFVSGTYVADEVYSFTTEPPHYSTTNVADAMGDILDLEDEWAFMALTGAEPTAASAATMAAAMGTHMISAENKFRYVHAIVDGGPEADSTTKTAFNSFESLRVNVCFDRCLMLSAKPFAGWGDPVRATVGGVAARTASVPISEHLGRVATGPLPGVRLLAAHHNEGKTETMDASGFTTFKRQPSRKGIFITRGRIRSGAGSDFDAVHLRRVMDVACRTVFVALGPYINASMRTTKTGTIDERDAARVESTVNGSVQGELLIPLNSEGTPGHVSAASYVIDKTISILQTKLVRGTLRIRPLGYAEVIETTVAFEVETPEAA